MKHAVIVTGLALLAVAVSSELAFGLYTRASKSNSDWPCQQILVSHLSPAAMWTGPSVQGLDKTSDPQIDELAANLAQRRLPIDQAKAQIDEFAKSAGPDRKQKLTLLFALLFDKLDGERAQVIGGLERFGRRQKEMANKIRAETKSCMRKRTNPSRRNRPMIRRAQCPSPPSNCNGICGSSRINTRHWPMSARCPCSSSRGFSHSRARSKAISIRAPSQPERDRLTRAGAAGAPLERKTGLSPGVRPVGMPERMRGRDCGTRIIRLRPSQAGQRVIGASCSSSSGIP